MAGRPFIQWYGLREVAEQGGRVYLGTVAARGPDDSLDLIIERVYVTSKMLREAGEEPPGTKVTLHLHKRFVQRDPRESPRDVRLIGGKDHAPVGSRVIAVSAPGWELLEANAENLRKLELLFGATPYQPDPRDLQDRDLCKLAYEGLLAKKLLRDEDVVRAEPEIVERHFRSLGAADKRRFVQALTPLAARDLDACKAIIRVVVDVREPAVLADLAAIVAHREAEVAEVLWSGLSQWDTLATAGETPPPDFSPLEPSLDAASLGASELLRRLFDRLDEPARVRLLQRALASAAAPREKPREVEVRLVQNTVPFVQKVPSPALLESLRLLDPNAPSWTWGAIVGTSLLEMATAIVRAHPETRAQTQAWLEPMLAADISAAVESERAWRALVGPPPLSTPLPAAEITLAEGERRYDPSGFWVMRAKDVIELSRRGVGRRRMNERFDEIPFGDNVLATSEHGKLRFIADPGLRHWDDHKAIALKTAEAAGCGTIGDGKQEGETGVVTFQTDAGTGRPGCTVRVALFTDRVDVEHRPGAH